MSAERVARARDDFRIGLRPGSFAQMPLDGAVDQALREGLALLTPSYPPHTVQFAVTAEMLAGEDLLDISAAAPDLYQVLALWWARDGRGADCLPVDGGRRVLFSPGAAPVVGETIGLTYRRVLAVEGFDGAVSSTLAPTWDYAWVKAALYAFTHAELLAAAGRADGRSAAVEVRERGLLLADRLARAAMDEAVASLLMPVRPLTWNRGL